MADQEHIRILRQSVDQWNKWRKTYKEIKPNLSSVNLSDTDLSDTDLSDTDLSDTDLSNTNLSNTDLSGANFNSTNFSGASLFNAYLFNVNLNNADLNNVDLNNANLNNANLNNADLSFASLSFANFSDTNLSNANFVGAKAYGTIFNNLDLRQVKGLEAIRHIGPSGITTSTLERSQGDIPEVFLRGTGLSDTFITYARSLVQSPIEYYTCFISYSSKNQDFAERLYADLQSKGVRCWFAPEDMKTGDKIRHRIDTSIRMYDKLLLILSEASVESLWVEHEVETAIGKELEGRANVLFPVRLDDAVMQSTVGWASHIKLTRHITDFSQWKHHDAYQKSLDRLLRDLKADTAR
jgi:hypothetical protein